MENITIPKSCAFCDHCYVESGIEDMETACYGCTQIPFSSFGFYESLEKRDSKCPLEK